MLYWSYNCKFESPKKYKYHTVVFLIRLNFNDKQTMNTIRPFLHLGKQLYRKAWYSNIFFLFLVIIITGLSRSCETEREHTSPWFTYSISGYVEAHPDEYSEFNRILEEGKLWNTLSGYNPNAEGYTLFLPTNEAINHFLEQYPYAGSLSELVLDTGFLKTFTRYHTLNEKVHTEEMPYGVLNDRTLTGDRLVFNFLVEGDKQVIKVNNMATIVTANLELANGYIHIISDVIQPSDITGYDWIQQHEEYSILAEAMKLTGVKKRMDNLDSYTIFAENDSIYNRYGIYTIEDLINRIDSTETPFTESSSPLYQYTAYHVVYNEQYLNELEWGLNDYWTLADEPITIDPGIEIKINPGVTTYDTEISGGDTTVIDYILPVWENSNILTKTGPVHSITELLVSEPFPESDQ